MKTQVATAQLLSVPQMKLDRLYLRRHWLRWGFWSLRRTAGGDWREWDVVRKKRDGRDMVAEEGEAINNDRRNIMKSFTTSGSSTQRKGRLADIVVQRNCVWTSFSCSLVNGTFIPLNTLSFCCNFSTRSTALCFFEGAGLEFLTPNNSSSRLLPSRSLFPFPFWSFFRNSFAFWVAEAEALWQAFSPPSMCEIMAFFSPRTEPAAVQAKNLSK